MYTYTCSCIPLHQFYPLILNYSEYLDVLSLNSIIYIYKYTSERNFNQKISGLLEVNAIDNLNHFDEFFSSKCLYYSVIVIYIAFFIPCNLTTGMPRPLCSNACNFFRDFCNAEYTIGIKYLRLLGIAISDYCENTLEHINKLFHYPISSKDFESNCIDFTGNVHV